MNDKPKGNNFLNYEMGATEPPRSFDGRVITTHDTDPFYDPTDDFSGDEMVGVGTAVNKLKGGEEISIVDKLRTVYYEYGFLPASQEELTEIWEIRKYRDKPSGVAQYINNILKRQKSDSVKSANPNSAVFTKVQAWIDWQKVNLFDKKAIDYLLKLKGSDCVDSVDLLGDSFYKRGYKLVQRTHALNGVMERGTDKKPYDQVESHNIHDLGDNNIKQAAWQAYVSAEARGVFWLNIIIGARNHDTAKGLAQSAIDKVVLGRRRLTQY